MANASAVKNKKSEVRSSGSSDEDYEKYKAVAVDSSSISVERTTNHTSNKKYNNPRLNPASKPSLRTGNEELDLNTTPEFRDHISKKLAQIIDNKLEMVSQQPGVATNSVANENETGDGSIKLFSDSNPYSCTEAPKATKRRIVVSSSDSESEDERLKAAVVSAEFVLASSAIHNDRLDAVSVDAPQTPAGTETSVADSNTSESVRTGDTTFSLNQSGADNGGNQKKSKKKSKKKRKDSTE